MIGQVHNFLLIHLVAHLGATKNDLDDRPL